MTDPVERMFNLRQKVNEEDVETRRELLKGQLLKAIETKVKTAFIGALASFESRFGHLWGHGEMQLNEEQEQWRDEWQAARKEILDKGNDQIKLVRNELNKYDVKAATVKVAEIRRGV